MAAFYPIESGAVATPTRPVDAGAIRQLSKVSRTWTMAAQAAASTLEGLTLPKGFKPEFLKINPSATLASATLAVGIAGTAGKYRAAAVVTTSAQGFAPVLIGTAVKLTADEPIVVTTAADVLPASGTLEVQFWGTYE